MELPPENCLPDFKFDCLAIGEAQWMMHECCSDLHTVPELGIGASDDYWCRLTFKPCCCTSDLHCNHAQRPYGQIVLNFMAQICQLQSSLHGSDGDAADSRLSCTFKFMKMWWRTVTLLLGSKAPRTYRWTRHDLPTPCTLSHCCVSWWKMILGQFWQESSLCNFTGDNLPSACDKERKPETCCVCCSAWLFMLDSIVQEIIWLVK